MEIYGLDHVQLAMPPGQEDIARAFYGDLLGLTEQPKPANLAGRGGAWFTNGTLMLHLGVEHDFRPARKAHPALLVHGLQELADRCALAGYSVVTDEPLPGYDRFYVADPFGNRIELLEPRAGRSAKVVPELDVANLERALHFYTQIIGFGILYERPEERFVFLDLDGAQLMLEEAAGPGRRFRTAPLEHPYGRGVNIQVQVSDIDGRYERVRADGGEVIVPLEDRWYRINDQHEGGNRQFVVADPDGYLLRFFTDLGWRNKNAHK